LKRTKKKPQIEKANRSSKLILPASGDGNFTGVNFATLQPISEDAEVFLAGQSGTSGRAPQRL
jgi:hypothetical protein